MCTQSQNTAKSYLARANAGEEFNLTVFEFKPEGRAPEMRVTDLDLEKGYTNEEVEAHSFLFDDLFKEHDCDEYFRNVEIDHRHTLTIKKAQEHRAA